MDLDPVKLQQVIDRTAQLSKRLDALIARRVKADADRAQRKADKARAKADTHLASERALTVPPYDAPAWFPNNCEETHLDQEREELRQGALSKERV